MKPIEAMPSGEWIARLFANSHVAIGISRPADNRLVAANNAFVQLFGYKYRDILGRTSQELGIWPEPEEHARMMAALSRNEATGPFEARFRTRSGKTGDLQISASVVEMEHQKYLIGLLTDVTARKAAERANRLNETRLNAVMKLSDLLVFHQDANLRYTWIANPALGSTGDELIGRNDEEIMGSQDARPLTTIKRRVLRSGKGERQEVWVSNKGRTGCFDLIVEPERDADGAVTGVVCAAADITLRKQALDDLQMAYRSVGRFADHLRDEVESHRRELAREVHDEIGATLTGVRMHIDRLAQRAGDGEMDEIRSLIDQALATTRELCSRLRPPILDDVGLIAAMRWYVRDWSQQTGIRASIRIRAPAREPDEPLRTDLFRMLQELLTNVARHADARQVRITLSPARGALTLRVTDDGRGFAPGWSSGFGLLGIRERLQRHGGTLDIADAHPGATISLRLPQVAA